MTPWVPRDVCSPISNVTIFRAGASLLMLMLAVALCTPSAKALDGLTRNQVFELQFRLNQLQFDAGSPDGISGPRTRRAAAEAVSRLGLVEGSSANELLDAIRRETESIGGITQHDGRTDLLVFTDEGTPLILSVLSFGRLYVDEVGDYVRDWDVDGSPIYTTEAQVRIEEVDAIPLQPEVAFGYRVLVPAPPRGERLQVDHVTTWPAKPGEKAGTHSGRYEHIYRKPPSNPRNWSWTLRGDISALEEGVWHMSLENRGRELISRSIRVGQATSEAGVTWTATSNTAVSVTGDITVRDDELVFGDGTVLPLTFVAEKEAMWALLKTGAGRIFKLDPPVDPVLLNGTALCGMPTPVTYIVLSQDAPDSLTLTAFTGSSPPTGFGDHSCAAYHYERAAQGQKAERRPDWRTHVTDNPATAGLETTATDGRTILNGGCNVQRGPGFDGSLYDYAGDALQRIDDASEPVTFEIMDGQGERSAFAAAMHYFAPDRAWVLTDMLPVAFMDALAKGETFTIRNGRGDAVAAFDLGGAAQAVGVLRSACGYAPRAASAKDSDFVPRAASAQGSQEPLSVFQDCAECPEMIVLPVGSFVMGAGPEYDDLGAMTGLGPFREAVIEGVRAHFVGSERPAREVTISAPVALSKYEVTVGEIEAYVKETGEKVGGNCMVRLADSGPHAHKVTGTRAEGFDYHGLPNVAGITDGSPGQPGLPVTERHPATCINRDEVLGYLAWLSEKTGRQYRLPSEAEWEYAARAGTQTFAFWGNDMSKACRYANFGDRDSPYQMSMAAPCAETGDALWAAEVGQYEPNAWGFHDTVGNVQEMVEDCLHEGYEGAPTDGSAWTEPDCQVFVARGGDWELPVTAMRSSERLLYGYGPEAPLLLYGKDSGLSAETMEFLKSGRANGIGFRAAVNLD